jgi:hypothetical protein
MRALWQRGWFPAAILFIYLFNFPYFAGINSANELPRIYLTMAMVDRHAFNIDPELKKYVDSPDTSTFKGKLYSNKAPGMSFLAAPAYWVQKLVAGGKAPPLKQLFFWLRLFAATIPSLLFLLLLWRALGELIRELALRRLVLASYAVGSMAFTYGTLLIAHQLSSLLLGTAFILVFLYRRGHGGQGRLILAGLAAGAGVLVDYQVAFIGPPLGVYLLFAACRRESAKVWSWPVIRAALLFGLGALPPLLVLLHYQWVCFGSPWKTGYHYLTNPVFAQWHSKGFLGLSKFQPGNVAGRYFSADDGLFYYSPFLLLAAPGLYLMIRGRELRAEGIFCAAVILFFFYFAGAIAFVSGWDVGPRYITCALPYYLVAVAVAAPAMARRWWGRIPLYGLIAVGVIMYITIQAVFPHYPDNFSNPWFDVTLRFGRAGYLCYNGGWVLGLRGLASAAPYLAVSGALLLALLAGGALTRRQRLAVAGGALALAFSLLLAYHAQLANRRMPVPVKFLPWMEQIWEPRHPGMHLRKLLPAGDPRTGGLRTLAG